MTDIDTLIGSLGFHLQVDFAKAHVQKPSGCVEELKHETLSFNTPIEGHIYSHIFIQ